MLSLLRRRSGAAQLERAIRMFQLADEGLGEAIKQVHAERQSNDSRLAVEHDKVHRELAAADAEYRARVDAANAHREKTAAAHQTVHVKLLETQERAERVQGRIKGLLA